MRRILAFIRRDALIAASYRTQMLFSLGSLLTLIIPLYFIARAVQPIVGSAIEGEGEIYFAFVTIGLATYQFVTTAVTAVPMSLAAGIRTGTFEALLVTPSRLGAILVGLIGYPFLWTVARATVLLAAGQLLGAGFHLERIAVAILIWAAISFAYAAFGILASAMLLVTRTAGPLPSAVLMGSMFLGGVYYPTHVIPSWLQLISDVLPLTYGLRALRRVMSTDAPLISVAGDLGILLGIGAVLLVSSMLVLRVALMHARRAGSLAQY